MKTQKAKIVWDYITGEAQVWVYIGQGCWMQNRLMNQFPDVPRDPEELKKFPTDYNNPHIYLIKENKIEIFKSN